MWSLLSTTSAMVGARFPRPTLAAGFSQSPWMRAVSSLVVPSSPRPRWCFNGCTTSGGAKTTTRPVLSLSPLVNLLTRQSDRMWARCKHTLKTNKGVAKRFRPRGDGTLKRMKSGVSHNTGYKTRARKNRLGQSTTVTERKMEQKISRCLPL